MIFIIFGRIGQIILTFLTMRIATTILPPDEMARIFLISSAVAFFSAVLISPVGMFINRRLHAWNSKGKVPQYLNYFWFYLLIVSLVATGTVATLEGTSLFSFHTDLVWLMLLVLGSIMIPTMNLLIIPSLNLLGYREWFAYLTLATTAMSLGMAILMVVLTKPKAEYWLVGLLLGQLIIGLVGSRIFYQHIQSHHISRDNIEISMTNNHVKLMWKFAWPIFISAILSWGQTQGYRFFMERSLGLVEVGLFVTGYGISAGIISGFESVFTTYLQPVFYKKILNENLFEQSKAWSDYAGTIFPSLILVGFVILSVAPELTRAMVGAKYWSASQFIVWGVIAELARVASGIYGMIAHARMKTKLLIFPSVMGASLSIVLIWWLIPKYASTGVGVALMLSSVMAFVFTYIATHKEYEKTFSHNALIKSVLMGIVLILLAEFQRSFLNANIGFASTLGQLFVIGSVFLFFQYILLKPLLRGKPVHG